MEKLILNLNLKKYQILFSLQAIAFYSSLFNNLLYKKNISSVCPISYIITTQKQICDNP